MSQWYLNSKYKFCSFSRSTLGHNVSAAADTVSKNSCIDILSKTSRTNFGYSISGTILTHRVYSILLAVKYLGRISNRRFMFSTLCSELNCIR